MKKIPIGINKFLLNFFFIYLTFFLGLGLNFIYAKYLDYEEFSLIRYSIFVAQLISIFYTFGNGDIALKNILESSHKQKTKKTFDYIYSMLMINFLIFTIFILLSVYDIKFMLVALITIASLNFKFYFISVNKIFLYNFLEMVKNTIKFSIIFIFVYYTIDLNYIYLIAISYIISSFLIYSQYFYELKKIKTKTKRKLIDIINLIKIIKKQINEYIYNLYKLIYGFGVMVVAYYLLDYEEYSNLSIYYLVISSLNIFLISNNDFFKKSIFNNLGGRFFFSKTKYYWITNFLYISIASIFIILFLPDIFIYFFNDKYKIGPVKFLIVYSILIIYLEILISNIFFNFKKISKLNNFYLFFGLLFIVIFMINYQDILFNEVIVLLLSVKTLMIISILLLNFKIFKKLFLHNISRYER